VQPTGPDHSREFFGVDALGFLVVVSDLSQCFRMGNSHIQMFRQRILYVVVIAGRINRGLRASVPLDEVVEVRVLNANLFDDLSSRIQYCNLCVPFVDVCLPMTTVDDAEIHLFRLSWLPVDAAAGCTAHDSASFAHGPVRLKCPMALNSARSLAPQDWFTLAWRSRVSIESDNVIFDQSERL